MAKPAWKPWHEVMKLRDDVRTGELSLATFAADLYQVVMGEAKPVRVEGGEQNLPVRIAPPAVAGRRLNRSTAPGADATGLLSVE